MNNEPILVTGAHRSGTTWVGQTIALSDGLVYFHEPFNPNKTPFNKIKFCTLESKINYWFTYIGKHNQSIYFPLLLNVFSFNYEPISGIRLVRTIGELKYLTGIYFRQLRYKYFSHPKLIVKDPIALFSTPWLADKFNMSVIGVIRHPAAFADSLIRYEFDHPFAHFIYQKELFSQELNSFNEEIIEFAKNKKPVIDQAILLWRILYSQIIKYSENNPNWIFRRYEDMVSNPILEFKSLYNDLNLQFTKVIERKILNTLKPNAFGWKSKLNGDQIARIKSGTHDIWPFFYSSSDW